MTNHSELQSPMLSVEAQKGCPRIVFMGTPEFALESLKALVEGHYNVVAVVTQPDKPVGRHGSVLQPSVVKQYALSQGLPVLQPEKMKDPDFVEQLRSYHADLQVVVAFRMLPEVVWAMPPLGTFNVHAALLPQYRGAAPINWAIINGETETGITTFFLDHDIDTGRIIAQERMPIGETDNVEQVYDRLMVLGARMCLQTVDDIVAGRVQTVAQSRLAETEGPLRPAPKIFKDTCRIRWTEMTAKQVYDFIRGLSPVPVAWTELVDEDGRRLTLKIYAATYQPFTAEELHTVHPAPGHMIPERRRLGIAATDGIVWLSDVQASGKKRMDIASFLNGMRDIVAYKVE